MLYVMLACRYPVRLLCTMCHSLSVGGFTFWDLGF